MPIRADIQPDRIVRDPHRTRSLVWWGVYRDRLWTRKQGQSKWTMVRRISFTPARILAIASLLSLSE